MENIALVCGVFSAMLLVSAIVGFIVPGLQRIRMVYCLLTVSGGLILALPWWFSTRILQANQALPSRESLYAKMKEAAGKPSREAMFLKLQEAGLRPVVYEESYGERLSGDVKSMHFTQKEVDKSASYIWARSKEIRVDHVGLLPPSRYLQGVFLFDSKGKLIAWTSWTYSLGP